MKRIYLVAALILLGAFSLSGLGQTRSAPSPRRQTATRPNQASSLLNTLPASDAVALVKVRHVFDEVLPSLFAANTAKLAEIESRIQDFKRRTGLDPRAFDELAVGTTFKHPSAGITRMETVALARGSFSPTALVAAGKVAASGAYREETHQNKKIYIFAIDQQFRILGLFNLNIRELAISPLDANTLVLGDLERVRGTIATTTGAGRANAELISLASQDANAIMSFGANLSPEVLQNLKIGNDAIATNLSAVRQVYGSVGASDKNMELLLAARTVNANSARNLSDTVEGLRQLGAVFVSQMSSVKGSLARRALENLKITNQGNELQIRTAVSQADVAPLLGGF